MRPYHCRNNIIVGANCLRHLLITSARNRAEGLKTLALSGGERKALATQEHKGFCFLAHEVILLF
jgi:hypothetical protein